MGAGQHCVDVPLATLTTLTSSQHKAFFLQLVLQESCGTHERKACGRVGCADRTSNHERPPRPVTPLQFRSQQQAQKLTFQGL